MLMALKRHGYNRRLTLEKTFAADDLQTETVSMFEIVASTR